MIPTYEEPEEVLLPAIAAALAMRLPLETWVLDDGNRPEIKQLAEERGANYLARERNTDAKAGNLNNAITQVAADYYVFFDADHVAQRDFLRKNAGLLHGSEGRCGADAAGLLQPRVVRA